MTILPRDRVPPPTARMSRWRSLVVGLVVSFLAHALWEIAQMPLYVAPVRPGLVAVLIHCGLKAASGDLLLMGILFLMVSLALGSWRWPVEAASYRCQVAPEYPPPSRVEFPPSQAVTVGVD